MEVSSIENYYASVANNNIEAVSNSSSIEETSLPPAEPGVGQNIDIIG
ncbi:MAG TPA: hypothetical protein PLE45_03745 [Spirochaetota bacterium]|nr:hypothetical protein [Spirochaetota bacterium]HOL56376.1 hypothetical protein [Spirochaetota bacterium]HPP03649.1 hypothetical protein [Spirochaetota bacterium]